VLYLLEILGVACFAVSGVAASRSKRPDLVGAIAVMRLPAVIQRFGSTLRIADAFGLGLFNAAGTIKALASGAIDPAFAIVLGAITGAGGGVIRDVLCNEIRRYCAPASST
jgi:uncharacterized membrane protein YeiH